MPSTFNHNMIHTNPPPNIVTSRPPIPTIPTNPLQYNLSSTNMHTSKNYGSSLGHHTPAVTSNNTIQHNNVSVPPSSSIRTNPFFIPVSQIPTNTDILQRNTPYSNYHITYITAYSAINYSLKSYLYTLFCFYL